MPTIAIDSPIGTLALQECDDAITRVAFVFGRRENAKEKTPERLLGREREPFETFSADDWTELARVRFNDVLRETPLLRRLEEELREYFKGARKSFDLPLAPQGTDFRKKVWKELTRVPYGATETYGGLAKKIGAPNAARAIGAAMRENPIGILQPCHRVVGASGALTGFNGGIERKIFLLDLEKKALQTSALD